MNLKTSLLLTVVLLSACHSSYKLQLPKQPGKGLTGNEFYKQAAAYNWKQRDSLAELGILKGNIPSFLKKFVKINTSITDSSGKKISAYYFVMPDYLSVGNDDDFARVPITPMAAQMIADSLNCFLSTRKMVDDIYKQSKVKLEPVPMYAYRDSSPTMWQHHLIIEGQRKGRKGLIAGIKKDVVITEKLTRDLKPNRVAIYGWHLLNGKPIQPLYTGHVNWYVDYSHGIRLVYRKINVNGKMLDYMDVMKDRTLKRLLCNEEFCDVYRY